jgi:Mrp family chromosome partitioning ATPase/uncharacterized protein involved in exopolysaccharide biosynthesis
MIVHDPMYGNAPPMVASGHGPDVDSAQRAAPYRRLHRLLRGRYHLLIPAMIVAMIAGGIKGWRSQAPIYRSEGMIHVANSLPRVMNSTDQNEPLQMYEEFIDSQVLLMQSRHVIALAVEDPDFRAVAGTMNVEEFAPDFMVEHPPRTESLNVSYMSRNPLAAAEGVKAVVAAFLASSGENDTTDDQRRLEVLTDRRQSLSDQISALKDHVAAIRLPSATSIAIVDENMRDLFRERSELDSRIMTMQTGGYGGNFPQLTNAKAQMAGLLSKIEEYRKEFAELQVATAVSPPQDRHIPMLAEYLPYAQQMDDLRTQLEETNHRIDMLQTEASLGAERFRIISAGEVPTMPYADRRPRVAAVGAIAAGCVPLGLLALLGMLDRRLRFSDDAHDVLNEVPLLGVLPVLEDGKTRPELAKIAAYCVHNLRIRLQLLLGSRSQGTFMITSAAPGEGKTSLTLALGLSFASSGKRVLMVDGDLVGQGLSHRLGRQASEGLAECMDAGKLLPPESICPNLSLLPVGKVDEGREEYGFTVDEINDVLKVATASFDIILIDTGPALATLHTSVIAQVADHVIMTITNGQQQSLVRQTIAKLRTVGINPSGFVFNRAKEKDYEGWIGGAAYYKYSSTSVARLRVAASNNGAPTYGPLAASVAKRGAPSAVKRTWQ